MKKASELKRQEGLGKRFTMKLKVLADPIDRAGTKGNFNYSFRSFWVKTLDEKGVLDLVDSLLNHEKGYFKGLENDVETLFSYDEDGGLTANLSANKKAKEPIAGVDDVKKGDEVEFTFTIKPNKAKDRINMNVVKLNILGGDAPNENEISEEDIADGGLV